jgi:glycosyltransferase involved in cell wall biosynthesis
VGGVERAVRDLCERLVREHGFEVTVLTTDAYDNSGFRDPGARRIGPLEEFVNGVLVRRFPVRRRVGSLLRIPQSAAWRLRLPGNDRVRTWFHGPLSPGLKRAAREIAADVLAAASFPLNHLFYPFDRPPPRPPVVLMASIHPEDAWGYERPCVLRLTKMAAATVARTDPERNWLIERGAPADRVVVIPHGIALPTRPPRRGAFRAAHGIGKDDFLVGFVGQQGAHKGIEDLLAVLPRLLAVEPSAWLVVAGSPTPYSAHIAREATRLPRAARRRLLLFAGVSDAVRDELLRDLDVFASPSRYESFGLTTLEAWAQTLPVVIGDGPAPRWVVNEGKAGVLVPPGNREELLEQLARLARDPGLRRELGAAGRSRLERLFTLDREAGTYAELYRSVARLPD